MSTIINVECFHEGFFEDAELVLMITIIVWVINVKMLRENQQFPPFMILEFIGRIVVILNWRIP